MQIDGKIIFWVWGLCWFCPFDMQAMQPVKGAMSGYNVELISAFNSGQGYEIAGRARDKHYVIIGAFKEIENADKLIIRVTSVGFEPKYFLNKKRGLYYVYIVIYDNVKAAHRVSSKLREVNFIKDAWVFSVKRDEAITERLIASVEDKDRELLSDAGTNDPGKEEESPKPAPKKAEEAVEKKKTHEEAIKKELVGEQGTPPESKNPEIPKGKAVAASFRSTGSKAINELVQADKGDIIIFEDLLFHKNSSVLRKVSKDEMSRLNDILKANENLRIKIHGHTNGDFKGEIYLLDENDDRFFKLSGKNKVVKGDDKLLSAERAKVIKRYLGAQGIDLSRIETQGWGDRRMLYPKGHLKAPLNRRVEIEILEN